MRPGVRAVGAAAVLGLALVSGGPAASAGAATAVPYTDPGAAGTIGLCNQAGQQITSGNVNTKPFAWRAVSSVPAPSPYNNTGRTAVLVAYQPQQELPAGDWSGAQLTASSHYSNPTNPMAAATDGDTSLGTFIQDYPPKWDGFIELRMYLGTDNEPSYQEKYPVLNIKITGSTWHAVGGAPVSCSSGTAESIETVLLPSTTTTVPKASTQPASAGATAGASGGGGTPGAAGTSSPSQSAAASGSDKGGSKVSPATSGGGTSKTTASTSSTPVGLIVGVIAAVVVLLGAAWLLLSRRRRTGSAGPTTDPGPEGGAQGPGGVQGPDVGPQTDAGEGPVSDHEQATSQMAATKGE